MADGDTYLLDVEGETLLDTGGEEAIHKNCCCDPCSKCYGVQDDATVDGTAGCDSPCQSDGTYVFVKMEDAPAGACRWVYCRNSNLDLFIEYYPATGTWKALILYDLRVTFFSDPATGISCNKTTGKLEGTCVVPGVGVEEGYDCTGCTATVML